MQSLTSKLLMTFVPLFVIAVGASYYLSTTAAEEQMIEQAKAASLQKAHIVREALVSQMVDKYMVEDGFLERIRTAGGIKELYVRIRPENLRLMEDLLDDTTRPARLMKRVQFAAAKGSIGEEVFETGIPLWVLHEDEVEAIIPFKAEKKCQSCHEVALNHVLGVAHIQVPLAEIQASIMESSNQLAIISGVFGALTLLIAFLFYRSLIQKPVGSLVKATEAIAQGNLSYEMGARASNDELGVLMRSFDNMRRTIKQGQEALRTSTVGQVAQSLVRDFRAPMRQILSSIEQMEKAGGEPERRTLAVSAMNAAQAMNKITQDLMDFTTGEMRVNKMASSVPSLLNYVKDAVAADLRRDAIRFEVQSGYSGNAPLDYERIARAITNIVMYSANYVPPDGFIKLAAESKGDRLLFRISHNGSAIAAEFLPRIFEPFVKIVQEKGVGLDMALAKRIVEMQGGTITVDSKEG
ncbi:MAG TPA: HAMP domain-containing sensor histidine kinase, partial [Bacteroidota bacterium]